MSINDSENARTDLRGRGGYIAVAARQAAKPSKANSCRSSSRRALCVYMYIYIFIAAVCVYVYTRELYI